MINSLKQNEIFVFGSNLEGRHIVGAAKQATEQFGAIEGQGVGLQGQSYAIPTMNGTEVFQNAVHDFIHFAWSHPKQKFLLTKVGCGIAGYSESEVQKIFQVATRTGWPKNIVRPEGWA